MLNIYHILQRRLEHSNYCLTVAVGVVTQVNNDSADSAVNPIILLKAGAGSIKLNVHEAFVWDLVQKGYTYKKIAVQYFFKFDLLGVEYLNGLFDNWLHQGFLEGDRDVFRLLEHKAESTHSAWIGTVNKLAAYDFRFRSPNPWFVKLYSVFGVLFNRWVVTVLLGLATAGLGVFILTKGLNPVSLTSNPLQNFLLLFALNFIYLGIHETAHALMMKKYKLSVNHAGFMLYFGLPVFYVDSTAAWTLPKDKRIAITVAGVVSNYIFAGITAIVVLLAFSATGNSQAANSGFLVLFLQQVVYINLLSIISNLIPFVEFDGYYLLIDLLNEPEARSRSLHYLWDLLRGKVNLRDPKARFYLWFGIASVLATIWLIYYSFWFWYQLILKVV